MRVDHRERRALDMAWMPAFVVKTYQEPSDTPRTLPLTQRSFVLATRAEHGAQARAGMLFGRCVITFST